MTDTTSDEDIGKLINNRQNGRRRGRGGGPGAPRPNGSNGGQDRGNRIDNRARGNAAQLHEKYKALARDAQMQGDRVNTEYYLQFADHYFRVLSESRSRFEEQQPRPRRDDYAMQSEEDYADEGERIGNDDRGPAEPGFAARDPGQGQRYEMRPAADGDGADRGNEDEGGIEQGERRSRRSRAPRPRDDQPTGSADNAREASPAVEPMLPLASEEAVEAAPVRRRGRPPKTQAAEQIEVDRLPPSFALKPPVNDGGGEEGEDKPRRRTRRPRGETAAA